MGFGEDLGLVLGAVEFMRVRVRVMARVTVAVRISFMVLVTAMKQCTT